MGKQNDAFTAYLGRAEVLADLYNGCLYQGEEVVQVGNLCEVQQFYQQGLSERVKRPTARRRERDAIRAFWNEKSYVLLAAEAQNQPHLTMPFRCMEYDLAEYARQLRYIRLKSEGKLKTGVEYLSKMGRKDIIKIEGDLAINFDVLGFIDNNITVCTIKNGELVKKENIVLPRRIKNVVKCKNPRCITSTEENLDQIFVLCDEKAHRYRCLYCEQAYKSHE